MPPYLGGIKLLGSPTWVSTHGLLVAFTSTWGAACFYQLYNGRRLAGVTTSPTARKLVALVQPSAYPPHVTLLAVDSDNRRTDYGATLPVRPYNRATITLPAGATASWAAAGATHIDVTGGTVPGGAVDSTNLLTRESYDVDREYQLRTPQRPGSGVWNFEVAGRDSSAGGGNLGDAVAVSTKLDVYPTDLPFDADGNRFAVSIADQTATFDFASA